MTHGHDHRSAVVGWGCQGDCLGGRLTKKITENNEKKTVPPSILMKKQGKTFGSCQQPPVQKVNLGTIKHDLEA